jgi:predicted acyl esterase
MAERHVWIPMADGVRLAASLHLPDTADPCPVLLEALPYRKAGCRHRPGAGAGPLV